VPSPTDTAPAIALDDLYLARRQHPRDLARPGLAPQQRLERVSGGASFHPRLAGMDFPDALHEESRLHLLQHDTTDSEPGGVQELIDCVGWRDQQAGGLFSLTPSGGATPHWQFIAESRGGASPLEALEALGDVGTLREASDPAISRVQGDGAGCAGATRGTGPIRLARNRFMSE